MHPRNGCKLNKAFMLLDWALINLIEGLEILMSNSALATSEKIHNTAIIHAVIFSIQRKLLRKPGKLHLFPLRRVKTNSCSTHPHPLQSSLPSPRTSSHKSSFIPRTLNLWNVLLPLYFQKPTTCRLLIPKSINLL